MTPIILLIKYAHMRVICHALRAVSSHACPCHHLFTCFPVEGHKCSESLKYDHEIYDRIEEKLLQSYKCELIDILKSENELRMICNDVKKEILRESIDPFNDDDMSDISDISDIESDDGMKIDKHDNKSQKSINSDVANVMRELTRSRNSIVKMKFCFVCK